MIMCITILLGWSMELIMHKGIRPQLINGQKHRYSISEFQFRILIDSCACSYTLMQISNRTWVRNTRRTQGIQIEPFHNRMAACHLMYACMCETTSSLVSSKTAGKWIWWQRSYNLHWISTKKNHHQVKQSIISYCRHLWNKMVCNRLYNLRFVYICIGELAPAHASDGQKTNFLK